MDFCMFTTRCINHQARNLNLYYSESTCLYHYYIDLPQFLYGLEDK